MLECFILRLARHVRFRKKQQQHSFTVTVLLVLLNVLLTVSSFWQLRLAYFLHGSHPGRMRMVLQAREVVRGLNNIIQTHFP